MSSPPPPEQPAWSAERETLLNSILASARDYAHVTMTPTGRITSWSAGARNLFGWEETEIVGQPGSLIFTPEDRAVGAFESELATANRTGRAENERWHMRKDGSRFWGSGLLVPLTGHDGFLKIMRDRTESRLAAAALRRSEVKFRALVEHIPQLVWVSRGSGEWIWVSPQWVTFTGLSDEQSLGPGWLDAVHPSDRRATLDAWREAEAKGAFLHEHRIRRTASGDWRWMQSRATLMTVGPHDTQEWFGTSTDVHDLKRMQDQHKVLLRELHHRSRNLLAIINSIARRTAATSDTVGEFEDRFTKRVAAIARVQGFVSQEDRDELELSELIRAEVAAHGAGLEHRISIEGPTVALRERAAETIALAIHELATNAVKHGVLGQPEGRLSIRWRVRPENWLVIDWRESGLDLADRDVTAPRGYGRELLEVALPHALGAQTRFEMRDDGIACTIELPGQF